MAAAVVATILVLLSFTVTQYIMTKNDCYKANKRINPTGIMVHSVGCKGTTFERWKKWNAPGIAKCVHAFVDWSKTDKTGIFQCLPWNWRGWHAGGSANNNYIGFEICEPKDDKKLDPAAFKRAYERAVFFVAKRCIEYGIKPVKPFLIDHREGHALGIASNHGDVNHWFPLYGKNMNIFRADVAKQISLIKGTTQPSTPTTPTKPPVPPPPTPIYYTEYTVLRGECLSVIGKKFNVAWRDIAALNGILGPEYTVRAGQKIKIPTSVVVQPKRIYIVKADDTLYGIARALNIKGVTYESIARANNIPAPYIIHAGEELLIV